MAENVDRIRQRRLFPSSGSTRRRGASVPEDWEVEQPKRFNTVVEEIHGGANTVCENYDALIRAGRGKLGVA